MRALGGAAVAFAFLWVVYHSGKRALGAVRRWREARAPWRREVRSAGGSLVVRIVKPGQEPHIIKVLPRGSDTMQLLEAEALADELAALLNIE